MPPYDFAPLAFISWVPLLLLPGKVRIGRLLAFSFLHSITFNLLSQWWLVPALMDFASAPPWAAVGALGLLVTFQGTRTPLVLLAVHLGKGCRYPIWLSFPIASAVAESLHPHFFPWTMALQVQSMPMWLQAAAFGGPAAITIAVATINALIAEAWTHRSRRRHSLGLAGAAAGTLLLVSIQGYAAIEEREAEERVAERGIVAIGHVESVSGSRERNTVSALRSATIEAAQKSARIDLAIWPETVVTAVTPRAGLPRLARDFLLRDRAQGLRAAVIDTPLLFGGSVEESSHLYNSAVLVRWPGVVLGRYDKRNLVLVGESSRPAAHLPSLERWFQAVTPYEIGTKSTGLALEGRRMGVSICYEDILGASFRSGVVETEPELLVNLTSDSWFRKSAAIHLHFGLARLRSVEHRKYLVRSTRDGVTSVIDSAGRVRFATTGTKTGVHLAEVRWLPGLTPYARFGETWLAVLAILSLLAAPLAARLGCVSTP